MANIYEDYYTKKPKSIVTANTVAPSNIQTARALLTTPKLKTPAVTSSNVAPSNIQTARALLTTKKVPPNTTAKSTVTVKPKTTTTVTVKPKTVTVKPKTVTVKPKTVTPTVTPPQAPQAEPFDYEAMMAEIQRQNQAMIDAQMQQQGDIEARINALNQAKQDQAVANFGKARDTQLSNLTGEEAGIKPMYYDKRNATAATNMIGRRTLAEELAARGETKSGVADEANIRANMSLQGETGLLNRQESADITDIARRRTGVQNAYESDVASAKSGFESAAMQSLIEQYNTDRQFKLQEAGLTGNYSGNQTLEALNSARNFSLNESGVTGSYNGNQTMAAQNQAFNQNTTTQQLNQAASQQKLDNLYRQQTFDYQKSRDSVGDNQWQKSMNLDLRQQSFSETQAQISNALSQKRISQDDASQALQWAKFNSDNDPNSLDNQYKKAQIDSLSGKTNTGTTSTVDDYASTINSIYVLKPNANNNYQSSIDTTGIIKYIDNLINSGVDETITDSLAARYGIQ